MLTLWDLADDFSSFINDEMRERKLTTKELARRSGLSADLISMYRRGVRRPSLDSLPCILEVFGYSCELRRVFQID